MAPPRPPAICRSCRAQIVWASTAANGKPIPLDLEPNGAGNVTLAEGELGLVATVLGPLEVALADSRELYMPHHATCPDADQWKGPR